MLLTINFYGYIKRFINTLFRIKNVLGCCQPNLTFKYHDNIHFKKYYNYLIKSVLADYNIKILRFIFRYI